jgi:hypothetical protein
MTNLEKLSSILALIAAFGVIVGVLAFERPLSSPASAQQPISVSSR